MHGSRTARIAMAALAVAAIAACSDDTTAPATSFYSTLNGAKAGTPATATGAATFAVAGSNINFDLQTSGLSGAPSSVEIRLGEADESSSTAVVDVCGGSGPACDADGSMSGTAALVAGEDLDDVVNEMRTFGAYVSVYTATYASGDGEIRGQILGVY